MYFPTPYADEIIGSVVARACVHLGLSPKRLLRLVLGRPDGQMSFFLPSDLNTLARLTRTSAERLVMEHTVLPYVTAYMPPAQARFLRDKVLTSRAAGNTELASLVKSVTHGSKFYLLCAQCVQEDMALHGESYWRRSHLLPGVYVCPTHLSPLLEVMPLGTGRAFLALGADTPPPRLGACVPELPPPALLRELSRISAATLAFDWAHRNDWSTCYREHALTKGYRLVGGDVASSQLSEDLTSTFSTDFLQRLGCPVGTHLASAWPALMVRAKVAGPFSPIKHVLVAAFLATCPVRQMSPAYKKPGRRPADSTKLDAICAERIRGIWSQAERNQNRLTVKALLTAAGMWSMFRHNRGKFPKTGAFVEEFRRSAQAERQVGGREFWRN